MPGYFEFTYFGPPDGIVAAELTGEDLEQALAAYLKADTSIASIVGPRVYPITAPQSSTLPDLLYRMISGETMHSLTGYSGISTARIRLTARSRRISDCAALRKCVFQLNGFRGMFGPVLIDSCKFADVQDEFDDPPKGATEGTYMRQFDLHFRYRETIPSN